MRCFISINLDNRTLSAVENVKELVVRTLSSPEKYYIKWEPQNKLHLTVLFLGEIERDSLPDIIDKLSTVNVQPIYFTFEKVGAFPNLTSARVIILEGNDKTGNANRLYQSICENLQPIGFIPDKIFKPHITLGRVKRINSISLLELRDISFPTIRFETKMFALMESKLLPEGSKYRLIKEFI